jgi:hypothetical protein
MKAWVLFNLPSRFLVIVIIRKKERKQALHRNAVKVCLERIEVITLKINGGGAVVDAM